MEIVRGKLLDSETVEDGEDERVEVDGGFTISKSKP